MEGMTGCLFCGPADEEIVVQGRLWYAKWDRYPVSSGHLLLIPFRHVAGLFDATEEETAELPRLLHEAKAMVDGEFHPDGYNVGVNCGEAAGQTVMHLHVHLIPRYRGDMDDPRGGCPGRDPEPAGVLRVKMGVNCADSVTTKFYP